EQKPAEGVHERETPRARRLDHEERNRHLARPAPVGGAAGGHAGAQADGARDRQPKPDLRRRQPDRPREEHGRARHEQAVADRVDERCEREAASARRRRQSAGQRRRRSPRRDQNSVSIQPMWERSSLPTFSTGAFACSARSRWKLSWPARFSAIHSRAKAPDWISSRIFFISARTWASM